MNSFNQVRYVVGLVTTLVVMAWMTAGANAASTVIADWKFEPDNFLADSSGNGHTLTAAPATATPGGGADVTFDGAATSETGSLYSNTNNHSGTTGAAAFDGTQSLITTNTLGLNAYTSITMEWFMKGTGQANAGSVQPLFAGSPADINGVNGDFSISAGAPNYLRDFGAGNLSLASMDTNWHEYAIVLDTAVGTGTGMKLYEDYTLVASTATNALPFTDKDFVLGKDYYGGSGGLAGSPEFGSAAYGRTLIGDLDEVSISSGLLGPGTFLSETPEPASLSLVLVGCAMLLRRRGRRA